VGFALLSDHFEKSHVPLELPRILPDDWKGGLRAALDRVRALVVPRQHRGRHHRRHHGGGRFPQEVHIGYLAAIVAASNAGGSGSVVGDTTTTMMWIDGVSPLAVFDAYIAAVVATMFLAFFAAKQQHAYQPIMKDSPEAVHVDWTRLGIVFWILILAIVANVVANLHFKEVLDHFPVIGIAVWVAILVAAPLRQPDWKLLPGAFKGSIFLLALVTCASMMPVEKLPPASALTTLGLGFLSSVFDNIPLTALALKQGGYDWGCSPTRWVSGAR
jgi:Na+/H+ antiporter NhaD/arsenite permease-like protein